MSFCGTLYLESPFDSRVLSKLLCSGQRNGIIAHMGVRSFESEFESTVSAWFKGARKGKPFWVPPLTYTSHNLADYSFIQALVHLKEFNPGPSYAMETEPDSPSGCFTVEVVSCCPPGSV